jgi:hypothetical protein
MATLKKQPKPILSVDKAKETKNFVLRARNIVLCVGNNSAIFKTPIPTLTFIANTLSELEMAEISSNISVRKLKYNAALKVICDLRNYVKSIADNADDEPTKTLIINASGFCLTSAIIKEDEQLNTNEWEHLIAIIL